MNLRHRILDYHVKWSGVVLNCTIAKLPQFIMQIMFFHNYSTLYGQMIVIAILLSLVGILLTLFQLCKLLSSNKFTKERIELTFHFDGIEDATDDEFNEYEIIDEVFGFRRYLTEYFAATINVDYPKYHLVCQFVEPRYSEACVKMMIEVAVGGRYTEKKLTNRRLERINKQLEKSNMVKIKINKLISTKYNDQFGSTSARSSPVKVDLITAAIICDGDRVSSDIERAMERYLDLQLNNIKIPEGKRVELRCTKGYVASGAFFVPSGVISPTTLADVQMKRQLVHSEMKSNARQIQNYENNKSTSPNDSNQSLIQRIERQLAIKDASIIVQNNKIFDQSRFRILSDKSINDIYTAVNNLAIDFGYQTYFDEKLVEFSVFVSIKDDEVNGKDAEIRIRIIPESHININDSNSHDTNDRKDNTADDGDDYKQIEFNSDLKSTPRNYITTWRVDPNVKENQRIMSQLFLNPKMMDLSDPTFGDKTPIAWKVKL